MLGRRRARVAMCAAGAIASCQPQAGGGDICAVLTDDAAQRSVRQQFDGFCAFRYQRVR